MREPKTGAFRRKFFRGFGKAKGIILSLFLIVLFGIGIWGVHLLQITDIRIRRDAGLNSSKFGQVVGELAGKNLLFLRTGVWEKKLQKQFPEISSLHLIRSFPKTLIIEVSTSPAALLLHCTEKTKILDERGNIQEKNTEKTLRLTANGAPLQEFSGETELFQMTSSDACPQEGIAFFSGEQLEEIFWAKSEIEKITERAIPRGEYFSSAREIHFFLDDHTAIWLDFFRPFSEQIHAFRIALSLEPALTNPLHHVDLRVAGKIFYAP